MFDPNELPDEGVERFQLDGDIDDETALSFFEQEGEPPWFPGQPQNSGGQEHCVA